MLLQPKNDEYDKSINQIRSKIKQLKSNLVNDGENGAKKDYRSAQQQQLEVLNTEYEKLAQLRLDQCQSLKSQWETYRNEQRQYRKKDIDKRQVEFDKELDTLDNDRRRTWKNDNLEELSTERKNQICEELLNTLRDYIKPEEENEQDQGNHGTTIDTIDTTIITMPTDLLESFWLVDIDVPVMKSEIPSTIHLIENRKIS